MTKNYTESANKVNAAINALQQTILEEYNLHANIDIHIHSIYDNNEKLDNTNEPLFIIGGFTVEPLYLDLSNELIPNQRSAAYLDGNQGFRKSIIIYYKKENEK